MKKGEQEPLTSSQRPGTLLFSPTLLSSTTHTHTAVKEWMPSYGNALVETLKASERAF